MWRLCLVIIVGMMATCGACAGRDWRECIVTLGNYMNRKDGSWESNPCGFTKILPSNVTRLAFPTNGTGSGAPIIFGGDSLSLRAFIYAVNEYFPPNHVPAVVKVAHVPDRWEFAAYNPPLKASEVNTDTGKPVDDSGLEDRAKTMATFLNLRYVYHAHTIVSAEIEKVCQKQPAKPGVIFLTFGNWDLNWKLQKNVKVPGLSPNTLEGAMMYWTKYVALLFKSATVALDACRDSGGIPPYIIMREQFLPNCQASRFKGSRNKFRKCGTLLSPTVVPLYRRVLAGVAWSYSVPVVPTDHLFRQGSHCSIGDGLHLDGPCMPTEQQMYWTAYRHLLENKVVQTLHKSLNGVAPNARDMVNVIQFYDHIELLGLGKHYSKQLYPSYYGQRNGRSEPTDGDQPVSDVSTTTEAPDTLDVGPVKLEDFTEAPDRTHVYNSASSSTYSSSMLGPNLVLMSVGLVSLMLLFMLCRRIRQRTPPQA